MSRRFRFRIVLFLLISIVATTFQVEAQDSQGFITLDCGLPAGSSYVDEETGIKYISDEAFVETGVGASISPSYNTSGTKPWLQNLRSFPEGKKNCYTFAVEIGTQFLVRATFKYGDYDGRNRSLGFSMDVDSMNWDDIRVDDPATVISKEIILMTTINPLFFCLNNTGNGTPFISLLELRPLKDAPYNTSTGSLVNLMRVDFSSTSSGVVRYPDDVLDRFWNPLTNANWTTISTSEAIDSHDCFTFRLPSSVMRTASSPKIGDELEFVIDEPSKDVPIKLIHVYLYFAELQKLVVNQSRQFRIKSSSDFDSGPISPSYLETSIVYDAEFEFVYESQSKISLTKTRKSTLPPAINAFEIYHEIFRYSLHPGQGEVDAMMKIKLLYGVKKNWQGDPCNNAWDGVTCRYNVSGVMSLRIVTLNLSFSGLVGAIIADISDLTYLETLDLSNNSLTGHLPEFLAQMPFLKILNLTFNKLNGTVPCSLIEKLEKNLLLMNLTGNPDLILSPTSCQNRSLFVPAQTKKSLIVFLVLGSVAAALMSAVIAIIIIRSSVIAGRFIAEKKGQEACTESTKSLESIKEKKGGFTYSQLLAITNNLKVVLGQGGSGTVYHGYLHGEEVAVKILFPSTAQGYKQFKAEVDILLHVHHGNLLSLIGYCDDNDHLGLVYEYMANGNLQEYISSCDNKGTLSWEERLQIALGAAHGLEYLHSGCEPQIVHRDIKTANILLDEKLRPKLADFGLSRSFPATGASHLFTDVAGTFGYFDPEVSNGNSSWKSAVLLFIGQGGSGTVYLGHLHGNEVAVKILSPSSAQGYKQFHAEVDILLRVHHGNLLSLVGYCDENNNTGLIYEYMANGNLQEYISSGDKSETLSWEQRLKIAVGAAHGLEYLHSGCEPQIVHRDVKTANILLNEKLLAKLADFGLSRSFPTAGASHLFTDVAGTFGYFDPEYFRSRRFTTKSDVYSFGVVLLEIVTGKPAVDETEGTTHLSQWVATLLAEGEVTQIIDPKLGVDYDLNSVDKAVQMAMACVSEISSLRPTMHQVVVELTDCLEIELARRNDKHEVENFR